MCVTSVETEQAREGEDKTVTPKTRGDSTSARARSPTDDWQQKGMWLEYAS